MSETERILRESKDYFYTLNKQLIEVVNVLREKQIDLESKNSKLVAENSKLKSYIVKKLLRNERRNKA